MSMPIELHPMGHASKPLERPSVPKAPQSLCGRVVSWIPGCLGGSAVVVGTGLAVYGGVIHKYVFTGGGIVVDIAAVALAILYYRNIPSKNLEDSAKDIKNQNAALSNEVAVLKETLEENKKTISDLQASVAQASEKIAELRKVLADNAASLKEVTDKLTETKNALMQMQAISSIFRDGVADLANKVLKLTSSENEQIKKSVQELSIIIQKFDDLSGKIDEKVMVIRAENDQFNGDLQNYVNLMVQLRNVVDVLIPDFEAHKDADKELLQMKEQSVQMRHEIEELKKLQIDNQHLQETILEYQKLVQNLSDSKVMGQLSSLLQQKDDKTVMAKYLEQKFSSAEKIETFTALLKLTDSPEKLSRLIAALKV